MYVWYTKGEWKYGHHFCAWIGCGFEAIAPSESYWMIPGQED